jgi:hypothetical protein
LLERWGESAAGPTVAELRTLLQQIDRTDCILDLEWLSVQRADGGTFVTVVVQFSDWNIFTTLLARSAHLTDGLHSFSHVLCVGTSSAAAADV